MNTHLTAITLSNTLRLLNVARNPREAKKSLSNDVPVSLAVARRAPAPKSRDDSHSNPGLQR